MPALMLAVAPCAQMCVFRVCFRMRKRLLDASRMPGTAVVEPIVRDSPWFALLLFVWGEVTLWVAWVKVTGDLTFGRLLCYSAWTHIIWWADVECRLSRFTVVEATELAAQSS